MRNLRNRQRRLISGAVALLALGAWTASDEQTQPKPETQARAGISPTTTPSNQTGLMGNPADLGYANAADAVPTPSAVFVTDSQTGALAYAGKAGESRQALYDNLVKQKPSRTWADWDATISRGDPDELGMLIPAMGYALRREGTQDLYNEMAKRLYQSDGSVRDRLDVLGAMAYAATPESARVLLDYAQALELGSTANRDTAADQQVLLSSTQQAIQRASREFIDGSRNWAISPALESAWLNTGGDESVGTRAVIAQAIVYLGKPDGLKVLIDSVNQGSLSAEVSKVALASISQLRSNDAVPFLGQMLNHPTPSSYSANSYLTEDALVNSLVSVGSVEATNEIVSYRNRPAVEQP